MSFLVLGQRVAGDILVKDCNNIQTSYPDFMRDMIKLGGSLEEYASKVITIDSISSGKGTLAKLLSKQINFDL